MNGVTRIQLEKNNEDGCNGIIMDINLRSKLKIYIKKRDDQVRSFNHMER